MKVIEFVLAPFKDIEKRSSSYGDNIPELDGIRGLAVLIVLLSHTSAFGMYGQGSLGVLLFFFLSGFVLTIPFVENPKIIWQKKTLIKYFCNRFLRIVPIYWLACVLIYYYTSSPTDWLLWNLSFIKGWGHFWSVAQEVRFYILFPIVIFLLSVIGNLYARLMIIVILVYAFFQIKGYHLVDMMDGRHVSFYFWMFLGGVFCCQARAIKNIREILSKNVVKFPLLLTACLVVPFIFLSSTQNYQNILIQAFPFLPPDVVLNGWRKPGMWFCLFAILFIAVTSYRNTIISWIFRTALLRHFGLLSYSMYLFHMNIMFVFQAKGYHTEYLFFRVLAVSYFFAYLSYIFVEKPFLKLKKYV